MYLSSNHGPGVFPVIIAVLAVMAGVGILVWVVPRAYGRMGARPLLVIATIVLGIAMSVDHSQLSQRPQEALGLFGVFAIAGGLLLALMTRLGR